MDKLQQSLQKKGLNLLVLECDCFLWQKGEDLKDKMIQAYILVYEYLS